MGRTKTIDRRITKRSLQAINVANDVIDHIKKGKNINLQKIAVSNGYSVASARAQKPFQTASYKETIAPVLDLMHEIHQKALINLRERDYKREKMDSVINAAKQMVHDTQLLSGKSTENVANITVTYGSDDFLTMQQQGQIPK